MVHQTVSIKEQSNALCVRPYIEDKETISKLVLEHFGITIDETKPMKELCSYEDRNYLVTEAEWANKNESDNDNAARKFVFKIFNASETRLTKVYDTIQEATTACNSVSQDFQFPAFLSSVKKGRDPIAEIPLHKDFVSENCDLSDPDLRKRFSDVLTWKEESEEIVCYEKPEVRYFARHYLALYAFVEGDTLEVNDLSDENAQRIGKLTAQIRKSLQVCLNTILNMFCQCCFILWFRNINVRSAYGDATQFEFLYAFTVIYNFKLFHREKFNVICIDMTSV